MGVGVATGAVVMGVVPGIFLKPMEPAVRRTVDHIVGTSQPANAAVTPLPTPLAQEVAATPASPDLPPGSIPAAR